MTAEDILARLDPFLQMGQASVYAAFAVFARVSAMVALLPGLGENALPARVKLGGALALGALIWPAVAPLADLVGATPAELGRTMVAEAVCGMVLGLSVRLMIFALQMAGSMAAQATSVAQMFGEGLTADPQPAYANLLAVAGIVLAFALGLPAYAAAALIESYQHLPFGVFPLGAEVADWGARRVAGAFSLALSLAAPFVLAAFVYNVALGAINKAMPQLMVAFVGAPAITAGALLLMFLATPVALRHWGDDLTDVMAAPLFARP
ncbi:MAG: flagellar biosynthetic protein FliR [Rubrimonas sp.]|uniref:flagellar biosynthetic protein FliR n=1 Tax=Rubrimonas sp. TaxID=2036015 RepID=UPI002FDD2E73